MFPMVSRLPLILLLILLLAACSGRPKDSRLLELADIVNEEPEAVTDSLISINKADMGESDRHFFDFLTVKARDKAYITHTSDSLILDVIKYYKGHPYSNLYPEALYYGGRVYSDLGDYPSALDYFQQALDLLGDDDSALEIKYRVLSQTANILNTLRLYDEAVTYEKRALDIATKQIDTLKMINGAQLIGEIYLRAGLDSLAERYIINSIDLANKKYPVKLPKSIMYLARIKSHQGDNESAKQLITNALKSINEISRNTALAYAVEIFLNDNKPDSAFIFAKELSHNSSLSQKRIGYFYILCTELRKFIPSDSLDFYTSSYTSTVEQLYNENNNILALNQNAYYNYQLHEKERIEAEKSKNNLFYGLFISIIVILLMSFLVIILKFKRTKDRYQLKETLENVNRLRNFIQGVIPEDNQSEKFDVALENKTSNSGLREALRTGLISLYESRKNNCEISPIITNSSSYIKLQELIKSSKVLNDEAQLWKELEEIVLESSPEFKTRLKLLLGGKLSLQDYHTCILIKCGIPPKNMASLLRRSLNTISTRRETLGYKVFGKKIDNKVIDGIIRLL